MMWPRLPVGLSLTGCAPRSSNSSPIHIPRSWSLTPTSVLLQHCHRLLLSHLIGFDPSINRVAGTRITETVWEVAVELRETRLENKQIRDKKENKDAAEYFGANLEHLLNLVQVTN